MKTKYKILLISLVALIIFEFGFLLRNLVTGHTVSILSPAGTIAAQQRSLIAFAAILGLVIIVPVFALTFFIVWRYRDGNVSAKYRPNWDGNRKLELTWWGIPCAIILLLAVVTWRSSHSLDPYRALDSKTKPITVQVIALQWKWLFIYPEQNIATVNYLQIPEDTPVNFEITSDAPMNSFWIPQLGGQVYAMSGMTTKLHLMADKPGTYTGSSANISGKGFAGMNFKVVSSTKQDFGKWVESVWDSPDQLTYSEYNKLSQPSENNPIKLYGGRDQQLYDTVIMKYMGHNNSTASGETHVQ
jgi:cytochrome o ubiquinol oxidase subunit II